MNKFGFCLFLGLSSVLLRGDATGFLEPEKLAWHYTLAVQKGAQNYSFSIIKGGWLALDTWEDGEEMVENRIELTVPQFNGLKGKFTKTFAKMKTKSDLFSGSEPSYAFEEVADVVTTLEFKGVHSEISELLGDLSAISGKRLPFSVLE